MKRKNAQMNAAVLVAVISALIIIYIVFLPTDKRLEIIGDNDSTHSGKNSASDTEFLLEESAITMEHISKDSVDHELPSLSIYTTTGAEVIKEETSVYVKRGLFEKESKSIDFSVKDKDNTKNLILSFDVKKAEGRLIITLNDREIFNNNVKEGNAAPVTISNDLLLTDKLNVLKIEVSGVGIAFWATNEYILENVKVTGDVTDTSTRKSILTFIVPASEATNIEKSRLTFMPECQTGSVSPLAVSINEHRIYYAVPDCGIARPIDFLPDYMITGENTITFETDKGRYLIDGIILTNKLKETPAYTYYFDISKEDYNDVIDNNKIVNLTFYFVDDKEDKEAEIFVNNNKRYMTLHNDEQWSLKLNRDIEEGSNSLKIVPEKRLEVRKMTVELEDI